MWLRAIQPIPTVDIMSTKPNELTKPMPGKSQTTNQHLSERAAIVKYGNT